MEPNELIRAALKARVRAYAPYSGYQVGAALLGESGVLYTGCNVENASYPVTCCAERTALFHAVSQGERRFSALAVAGAKAGEQPPLSGYAAPCGVCRQALAEFGLDLTVYIARGEADYRTYRLSELLPAAFSLE